MPLRDSDAHDRFCCLTCRWAPMLPICLQALSDRLGQYDANIEEAFICIYSYS